MHMFNYLQLFDENTKAPTLSHHVLCVRESWCASENCGAIWENDFSRVSAQQKGKLLQNSTVGSLWRAAASGLAARLTNSGTPHIQRKGQRGTHSRTHNGPLAKLRTANFLSSSADFFVRCRIFSTSASATSTRFLRSLFSAVRVFIFSASPPAAAFMSSNTNLFAGNV